MIFQKQNGGKFYRESSEFKIPVYLEKDLAKFFNKIAKENNTNISKLVIKIFFKELEIYHSFISKK